MKFKASKNEIMESQENLLQIEGLWAMHLCAKNVNEPILRKADNRQTEEQTKKRTNEMFNCNPY